MVKVVTAEYSGVCFGVRRALKMLERSVKQAEDENRKAVMLGPLIHNPRVVDQYGKKGVEVVSLEDVCSGSIVVVRSHGITLDIEKKLQEMDEITVMDTTCPYVKRIHQLVSMRSEEGFSIIVMGDKDHSEVKGIASRIKGDYIVVSPDFSDEGEKLLAEFIKNHHKIFAVAQTTSRPSNYNKLLKKVRKLSIGSGGSFDFAKTVCTATLKRQDAAGELASRVDAVVVVGGGNSSNTAKLFAVVKERNERSFMVESPSSFSDKQIRLLEKCKLIGITAGASTPDDQIIEMKEFLEKL